MLVKSGMWYFESHEHFREAVTSHSSALHRTDFFSLLFNTIDCLLNVSSFRA